LRENYTILLRGLDYRTARPRSGWAERSGVCPTNPFGFSLGFLYPEMSSISINGFYDPLLLVNMFLPTWLDPVENILLQKMIGEKYTILDFGPLFMILCFWLICFYLLG
jgi:hypothetical protein